MASSGFCRFASKVLQYTIRGVFGQPSRSSAAAACVFLRLLEKKKPAYLAT